MQFFPAATARFSTEIPQSSRVWTMKERRDLKITLWVSVVTAIVAIVVPILTAVWIAGHKDQALTEVEARQASTERQIAAIRETLDKILLKAQNKAP